MIELIINGVFTGMGSAVGSYLATRYAIKRIENIELLILEKIKDKKD